MVVGLRMVFPELTSCQAAHWKDIFKEWYEFYSYCYSCSLQLRCKTHSD